MKYIFVLVEFKHTEFFTSYGGYLLNTKLYAPRVGFSFAGLDHAKLGIYQFQSFLFIVVIVISIYWNLHFDNFQSIVNHRWKFYSDPTRMKSLLKRLKNIGMASEKLLISKHLQSVIPRLKHCSKLLLKEPYCPPFEQGNFFSWSLDSFHDFRNCLRKIKFFWGFSFSLESR